MYVCMYRPGGSATCSSPRSSPSSSPAGSRFSSPRSFARTLARKAATAYDGPKRPNGGVLENLKVTERLRILRFFRLCGILRKTYRRFTENHRNYTKKYRKNKNSDKFHDLFIIFSDCLRIFENSGSGKCLVIFRCLPRKPRKTYLGYFCPS